MKQKAGKDTRTHNWLFRTLAEIPVFRYEALKLSLTEAQFKIIDAKNAKLSPTSMPMADGSLRDGDVVMEVPLKQQVGSRRIIKTRFLFEHKSRINRRGLVEQLIRYQHGLYKRENTPVINVVVNNGAVPRFGEVFQFRDWLEEMDGEFWRQYDRFVMNFDAKVLNLRDPVVQGRLMNVEFSTAIGWYAMGKVKDRIDEETAQNMIEMIGRLDEHSNAQIVQPSLDYLHTYHEEVTMEWLRDLEIQETGSDKVMARALSSLELKVQEGKSEIAMRLLREGLDTQFVVKVTELSRDRIEQIQCELKNDQ